MVKNIAIVEDDPDQRSNYVDAITKKGYQVVAYSSREEAIAGFEKELPVILEDIKQAFVFKSSRFSGVCVLSFEREAMSTSIPVEAAE